LTEFYAKKKRRPVDLVDYGYRLIHPTFFIAVVQLGLRHSYNQRQLQLALPVHLPM
jgi:hypothetical protein